MLPLQHAKDNSVVPISRPTSATIHIQMATPKSPLVEVVSFIRAAWIAPNATKEQAMAMDELTRANEEVMTARTETTMFGQKEE